MEWGNEKETWNADRQMLRLVKSLLSNKMDNVLYTLIRSHLDQCEEVSQAFFTRTLTSEAKSLTLSPVFNSNLENSINLKNFSFARQHAEAVEKAPYIMKMVEAIGINPRIGRNKNKSKESLQPSLLTSLNVLLNCRTQNCNQLSSIIGLILKQGQAKKLCVSRMHSLSLSTSYNTVIKKQIELGKDFLVPVQEWIDKAKVYSIMV